MILSLLFNPLLSIYMISPLFLRIFIIYYQRLPSNIDETLLVLSLLLNLQIYIIVDYDVPLLIIGSLWDGLYGRYVVEPYRAYF